MVEESIREGMDDSMINEGRFFALCSYIGILWLVPLFLKKENRFARFHCRQGLTIFIIEVAGLTLSGFPLIGPLLGIATFIVCSLLALIGIIKAAKGEYYKLPVVGGIAEKMDV